MLQQLQATTFLQAAQTTGLKAQLDQPGFTATVLAPSDAAFAAYLNGTGSSMPLLNLFFLIALPILAAVPRAGVNGRNLAY